MEKNLERSKKKVELAGKEGKAGLSRGEEQLWGTTRPEPTHKEDADTALRSGALAAPPEDPCSSPSSLIAAHRHL